MQSAQVCDVPFLVGLEEVASVLVEKEAPIFYRLPFERLGLCM